MGFALIMFVTLLLMSVVVISVTNYSIEKDSQITPLKSENVYASRETEKAQTVLTIVNTCLSGSGAYVDTTNGAGPYTLWLTVRNNGSTVLNPNNSTIFFNVSYSTFSVTTNVGSSVLFGNVWSPLMNVSIRAPDVSIAPNIKIYDLNYPYRLMIAASNGVTAIPPTAPTGFFGKSIKANTTYTFNWTASTSNTGISYYIIWDTKNPGTCPVSINNLFQIPGNQTSSNLGFDLTCPSPPCPNTYFFITAVDNLGNMGVPSQTINCNPPTSGQNCTNSGNPWG